MSAPLDGADVSDTVAVAGTASDDTGVAGVDLLVDDDPVASVEPGQRRGCDPRVEQRHPAQRHPHAAAPRAGCRGQPRSLRCRQVTVENVDEERPTPPSGLVGEWRRPSQVALSWSAATDNRAVTGYRVYRDGGELTTLGPAAREFVDAGVANLNTHTYTVSALDAAGQRERPERPGRGPDGRRHRALDAHAGSRADRRGRGHADLGRRRPTTGAWPATGSIATAACSTT